MKKQKIISIVSLISVTIFMCLIFVDMILKFRAEPILSLILVLLMIVILSVLLYLILKLVLYDKLNKLLVNHSKKIDEPLPDGWSSTYDISLSSNEKKEIPYFRDIPCNKDIFLAFYLSNLSKINENKKDLFGVMLLKWIKESKITIVDKVKSKKYDYYIVSIKLKENVEFNNYLEEDLYKSLFSVSNSYNIVTSEEIGKLEAKSKSINKWIDVVIENEIISLIELGKIRKYKKENIINTEYLKGEIYKLYGLKKFLNDFTLISKKGVLDVKILEYYLMYAQIFGIAEKVSKQIEKLYPEFNRIISFDNIFNITDFSYSMDNSCDRYTKHYNEIKELINTVSSSDTSSSSSSSSSGSGGGSSFGGGGFGGGGSGGGRF